MTYHFLGIAIGRIFFVIVFMETTSKDLTIARSIPVYTDSKYFSVRFLIKDDF